MKTFRSHPTHPHIVVPHRVFLRSTINTFPMLYSQPYLTVSNAVNEDASSPLFVRLLQGLVKVSPDGLVKGVEYFVPRPGTPDVYFGPLLFEQRNDDAAPHVDFVHSRDGNKYHSRIETLGRSGIYFPKDLNDKLLERLEYKVRSGKGDIQMREGTFLKRGYEPSPGDILGFSSAYERMTGPVTVVGVDPDREECTLQYNNAVFVMSFDDLANYAVVRLDAESRPIATEYPRPPREEPFTPAPVPVERKYVQAAVRPLDGPQWLFAQLDWGKSRTVLQRLGSCTNIKALVLDFDKTILKFHSYDSYIRSVDDVVRRGGPKLEDFASVSILPKILQVSPVPVYIASFGVHEVVLEFVRAFYNKFPADHVLTPSMFGEKDGTSMDDKNSMLKFVATKEGVPWSGVWLIDDDVSNVVLARREGFQGVIVPSEGGFTDALWYDFVNANCAAPAASTSAAPVAVPPPAPLSQEEIRRMYAEAGYSGGVRGATPGRRRRASRKKKTASRRRGKVSTRTRRAAAKTKRAARATTPRTRKLRKKSR